MLILFFPVGILITGINYSIDPANIFAAEKYVGGIADILTEGHNVDNISNYDERLLQEQMVRRLKYSPDVVILGSSRIMEIGSGFFPGKKILNCGVSHANIRNLVTITGLLDSLHCLPNEVLINVDPGLIEEEYTNEWESINPYFEYFIKKYSNETQFLMASGNFGRNKKLRSLFSIEYFQSSIRLMLSGRNGSYRDVLNEKPLTGRFSDGTISYATAYTKGNEHLIRENAFTTGKKKGITQPDKKQQQLFEILLGFYEQKGIKVKFCMLPYHNSFYQSVNTYHTNRFINYNTYFKQIAKDHKIEINGNFNPKLLGISDSSFYDMYHCSKFAIEKILINK